MQWSRRTLLGGIASASVPLAGCSLPSDGDGGADEGDGEGGRFEQVRVDGRTLIVELGSVSADTVNVIAPDGSADASKDIAQGARTVKFEIGLSYSPGEYRVVASAEESTVAETTLTIAPDLVITEVGVGANHPERMPDELNFSDEQAFVEVANRGTGPGVIQQILVLGEVPNPTSELSREGNNTSGIYDTESGFGNREQLTIPASESLTAFTTTKPFLFTGDGVACKSHPQQGKKFRVGIVVGSRDTLLSEQYSIRYSASEQADQCEIEIEESND